MRRCPTAIAWACMILPPEAYERWLSNIEPDPRDLLMPFPAELMMMWPISTRVNKSENDDPEIPEPFDIVSGSTPNLPATAKTALIGSGHASAAG